MKIKVQIFGDISVNSICQTENLNDCSNPLTFIAFSDTATIPTRDEVINGTKKAVDFLKSIIRQ